MKLYNTLTRTIENFAPLQDNTARVYSCGPTVYDHAHIGNLSAYIFADTLHRTLEAAGYTVEHAMNYTDVDDKTIRRSKERYADKEPREALHMLTDQYISVFLDELKKINNDTGSIRFIRATDDQTIAGMQELITKLHEKGFAYIADDGVYFSIEAYRKSGKIYGQLLEISASSTSESRIQNDEYSKESIHDFALWKKQKGDEPSWRFTLDGKDLTGRPGWHIECSVMSRQALGQPFDIHTGGVDLIFPHHENEIAQSTALEDNPAMARFFCHNEHILVDGKKMSKSANNFYTLDDIVQKGYDPLAFRLLVLQAHYRNQVNFSWESLEAAQNRLKDYRALADFRFQPITAAEYELTELDYGQYQIDITDTLQDDLNTPEVLRMVSLIANERHDSIYIDEREAFVSFLAFLDRVLGLRLLDSTDIDDSQKELISQRQIARETKDWQKSDELRNQLGKQGIGIRDTEYGSIWYRL
jgi:cysteinyl-tRNA synthetase